MFSGSSLSLTVVFSGLTLLFQKLDEKKAVKHVRNGTALTEIQRTPSAVLEKDTELDGPLVLQIP